MIIPLFDLGQIVATPGALSALDAAHINAATLIDRHVSGDFGNLDAHDIAQNHDAAMNGYRILSSYDLSTGATVWIITEWDRSVTTLLLPSEY